MTGICGRTSQTPFAYYDPASACLRTSQGTLDLGLTVSSPTLPPWGCMSDGVLYERRTPVPRTAGNGSSSLPGTPRAGGGDSVENNRERRNLEDHVARLLPTPLSDNSRGLPQPQTAYQSLPDAVIDFGPYREACERWEPVVGRAAPPPTVQDGPRRRLNPTFVEWMMGLPQRHVTGGQTSRVQQLKMLGNGVVPQQAALALELLDPR